MNNDGNNDALGVSTTTIAFGGSEITLTHSDAQAMETALLAYLASVDSSQVEDRDYLIAQTKGGPAWIDTDGILRVGAWILQTRSDRLVLTYRMPGPEDASAIKGYVATLVREDRWRVASMATERIRRRR